MTRVGSPAVYAWLAFLVVFCGVGGLVWLRVIPLGPPRAEPSGLGGPSASDPGGSVPGESLLALPERSAGLVLLGGADGELPARVAAMLRAGIDVRDMISGHYGVSVQAGEQLTFYGGTFTAPLDAGDLQTRAATILDDTFRVNFPNLDAAGTASREYEAGALGGHVRCRSYPDVSRYACGWVDRSTIGYTFGRAAGESDAAALLVALRADVQRQS